MGQVMDNLKLMKNVRDLESPQTLLERAKTYEA